MKGQFNLEQIVTMTLFVAFASYVFYTIFTLVPRYTSEVRAERLRSEAYQMSELLINDPGNPANWDKSLKPFRLGLSDDSVNLTNFLSKSKVAMLAGNCSAPNYAGFSDVSQWLGTDKQFSLLILSRNCVITGVDCRPNASVFRSSSMNVSIRRFVAFDNTCYGELDLEIW